MDIHFLIADRIQNLCFEKKITVNKMLADCGAGTRLVQNLKSGSYPSVDKFIKIADYLDCSVDYLLGRSEAPQSRQEDFSQEEMNLVYAYRCAKPDDRTIVNVALHKYMQPEAGKTVSAG